MSKNILITLSATLLFLFSSSLWAVDFMDTTWAQQACTAWNKSTVITSKLMKNAEDDSEEGYSWVKNNANRGYKIIQLYRTSCGETTKVQLNIVPQDNKAVCNYGGKPDGKKMNYGVDYIMHATDKDWACMGRGSFGCGPMGAMMSGKLKFKGPKMEAMKVMGPFASFLRLTGKVAGNKANCPKAN